jgi:hypothetical protein
LDIIAKPQPTVILPFKQQLMFDSKNQTTNEREPANNLLQTGERDY